MKLYKFLNTSINILLSSKCPGCNSYLISTDLPICPSCRNKLLKEGPPPPYSSKRIEKVWSCTKYIPLAKKCIAQFKYNNGQSLLPIFEEAISHTILTGKLFNNKIDLVIPVPIHSTKLFKRGYNQAEVLAKKVSKILNIPFCSSMLLKTKKTEPQTYLKRSSRIKNLKGSFLAVSGEKFTSKTVLLVDDVITTGATLEACGMELYKAGVNKIYGLTLARTL